MARKEEEREKITLLVALEYTKSSCLRLMKGLKEQKLKLDYLYFIPKSLPVCLWGHFSYCPHSWELHRTILEQEEVARTKRELTVFSFSALGKQMILANEHFFQESCAMKLGAWLGELN